MKKITKGVIYIATGKKYIEEALRSAASLKKHMPNLPITIFSDEDIKSPLFEKVIKTKKPRYTFEDKVRYISKSPYDHTLFLDTDTYLCDDISELFELLNRFDIAASHANVRKQYLVKKVPNSFAELNTGVILFKKSPKTKTFFSNWLKLYLRDKNRNVSDLYPPEFVNRGGKDFIKIKKRGILIKGISNQPTFREALYKSNLRIATLTKEYNAIAPLGFVNWKVKIIHSRRNRDLNLINKIINSTTLQRVYIWDKKIINVFDSSKNFSRVDTQSEKITKSRTKKIINYIDHTIGLFGIFLKKNSPKLYCRLKKLKNKLII